MTFVQRELTTLINNLHKNAPSLHNLLKTCDLFKDCIKTGKVQIKNSAEKLQGDDPDKACCEGAPKRKTCDTFQCPENRVKVHRT